jgi:hypothetical protein
MAKCNKKKLSKKEAASFLNYLQSHKGIILDKRKEKRCYHCPICNSWHTTQLESGEKRTVTEIEVSFKEKWEKLINGE